MIALPFVALDVLLVVLWTVAAALAITLIMDKLSAILAGVPWVGGKLSDAVRSMARAITGACGHLLSGTESFVGGGLHWLARHIETWLNQFVTHATVIAHLAEIVGNQIYDVSGLRALVHRFAKTLHGIEAGVKSLEKEWHGIEARVRKIEREIANGIGHDLRIQVKALEGDVTHIENVVVPDIRSIANSAETEVTDLEKWIAKNLPAIGTTAFVGAIAAALSSLGLGWLRCNSNPFNNNKNACGLWSDLSSLLGLAFIAAEVASLDELIGVAQNVTEDVIKGVEDLLQV